MDTADDDDIVGADPVVEPIGKLREKDPARLSVDYGVRLWVELDRGHRNVDSMSKGEAQALALRFVPPKGLLDVSFRQRCEESLLQRDPRWSRTFDQGRPSGLPA